MWPLLLSRAVWSRDVEHRASCRWAWLTAEAYPPLTCIWGENTQQQRENQQQWRESREIKEMRLGVRWKTEEGLDRGGMSGDEDGWHREWAGGRRRQISHRNNDISSLSGAVVYSFHSLVIRDGGDGTQRHSAACTEMQKSRSLFMWTKMLFRVSKHDRTWAEEWNWDTEDALYMRTFCSFNTCFDHNFHLFWTELCNAMVKLMRQETQALKLFCTIPTVVVGSSSLFGHWQFLFTLKCTNIRQLAASS